MSVRGPEDGGHYVGTHIWFYYDGPSASGKTKIWHVIALSGGDSLGFVKWFSRWRKYCFYPVGNTIFEETCLNEIVEFITDQTKEHRGTK